MTDEVRTEALKILEALIATPFEDCVALSRDFSALTTRHSIYAVRHRTDGLLYIGKSQNPKQRFAGGHKALVWCWFERYNPDDVRIATYSRLLQAVGNAIIGARKSNNPSHRTTIQRQDSHEGVIMQSAPQTHHLDPITALRFLGKATRTYQASASRTRRRDRLSS